jgi:hypothetical protein
MKSNFIWKFIGVAVGWNGLALANTFHCAEIITVTSVSEKPKVVSGVLSTWIKLEGRTENGSEESFFLAFLDEGAVYPTTGMKCGVAFHIGTVAGLVGDAVENQPIQSARIVDDFVCNN